MEVSRIIEPLPNALLGMIIYKASYQPPKDTNQNQQPSKNRLSSPNPFFSHSYPNPQSSPVLKAPSSKSAPACDSSHNRYAHTPSPHSADSPASSAAPPQHRACPAGSRWDPWPRPPRQSRAGRCGRRGRCRWR